MLKRLIAISGTVLAAATMSGCVISTGDYHQTEGYAVIEMEYVQDSSKGTVHRGVWEGEVTCELPNRPEDRKDSTYLFVGEDAEQFRIQKSLKANSIAARVPIDGMGIQMLASPPYDVPRDVEMSDIVNLEGELFSPSGGPPPVTYGGGGHPYGKITSLTLSCDGVEQ